MILGASVTILSFAQFTLVLTREQLKAEKTCTCCECCGSKCGCIVRACESRSIRKVRVQQKMAFYICYIHFTALDVVPSLQLSHFQRRYNTTIEIGRCQFSLCSQTWKYGHMWHMVESFCVFTCFNLLDSAFQKKRCTRPFFSVSSVRAYPPKGLGFSLFKSKSTKSNAPKVEGSIF
jgi:hypothetical protein